MYGLTSPTGRRHSNGLYTELADGDDFYKAHQPGEPVEL